MLCDIIKVQGVGMTAEIISIGTELLLGQSIDTNAPYLCRVLAGLGIPVSYRTTVGDNHQQIIEALRWSWGRADLLFTIGGLGPTQDDVTREAVAQVLEEPLQEDPQLWAEIQTFFARRNLPCPEINRRQALRPPSARPVPNPVGTAPGLIAEKGGKTLFCLPGPPKELIPMVENHILPHLRERVAPERGVIKWRVIKLAGIGESAAEEKVADLLASENPRIAPLAHTGEVHFRITARAPSEKDADTLIAQVERLLREKLGEDVFGADEDTLEKVVVTLLTERSQTLALAESCTGGLIGHRITNIPGSSKVFLGGITAYSNEVKIKQLEVPSSLLEKYGAVSSQTAVAMAEAIRKKLSSDFALGVTGIAGPTGGTPQKPVGLVYIACAGPDGTSVQEYKYIGDRQTIKQSASQSALDMLRRRLLKASQRGSIQG